MAQNPNKTAERRHGAHRVRPCDVAPRRCNEGVAPLQSGFARCPISALDTDGRTHARLACVLVQHSTLDASELHHHLAQQRQKLSLHILEGREWAVQFDPSQATHGTHLASDVAELNFPVYLFNILNEAIAPARDHPPSAPCDA